MADLKISQLTGATTPLAGTEVVPLVQSSTTKKVAVSDLTAGRQVAMAGCNSSDNLLVSAGKGVAWVSNASVYMTPEDNVQGARIATGGSFKLLVGGGNEALNVDGTTRNQTFTGGNLIQGTAAKGVNFTANTPAAGMTSQLLNWYEEGTWTPTVTAASGTITATNQGSRYTRVGKLVTAYGYLNISSVSSPSGTMTIGGLPFTNGSQYAACLLTLFGGSFTQSVGGYVDSNTTNIIATNLNANTAAAGGNIMVSASYMVA